MNDKDTARRAIVLLLEHISRGIEESTNLPDKETAGEQSSLSSSCAFTDITRVHVVFAQLTFRTRPSSNKASSTSPKSKYVFALYNMMTVTTIKGLLFIRTMESLQAESKKRKKELDLLVSSEPKLQRELTGLKEAIARIGTELAVRSIRCVCLSCSSLQIVIIVTIVLIVLIIMLPTSGAARH